MHYPFSLFPVKGLTFIPRILNLTINSMYLKVQIYFLCVFTKSAKNTLTLLYVFTKNINSHSKQDQFFKSVLGRMKIIIIFFLLFVLICIFGCEYIQKYKMHFFLTWCKFSSIFQQCLTLLNIRCNSLQFPLSAIFQSVPFASYLLTQLSGLFHVKYSNFVILAWCVSYIR